MFCDICSNSSVIWALVRFVKRMEIEIRHPMNKISHWLIMSRIIPFIHEMDSTINKVATIIQIIVSKSV